MTGGARDYPRTGMKPDVDFDTEWLDDAACAGVPTEIFFPYYHTRESTVEARNICKTCKVVKQCLQYAIDVPIDFGVWGGMLPNERRHYARAISYPRHKAGGN